jgi:LAS superfamily LD-carboxypeptidase LdcB
VKLEAQHTSKSDAYLRKEAYESFKKMYEAAKNEGISLKIISATRNFYDQKNIWESKWNGSYAKYAAGKERALAILKYSSMPGSSRHHWGTDMDFNELNDAHFTKNAEGKKIYAWLKAHASEYGFCQTYSKKGDERPNGYEEEKWHWSYLPLARGFMEQYREKIKYDNINGFLGSETAKDIQIIEKYVLGINPNCK